MSEAKHTPGPWRIGESQIVRADYSKGPREECTIAVCGGDSFDTRLRCDANTRLISAAPEMLKALKAGLSFVTHAADMQDWCGCEQCRVEWYELQKTFETAIVKAEGRE